MSEPDDDVNVLAAIVSRQSLDLEVYAGFLLQALSDALPAELVSVRRRSSLGGRLRGRPPAVIEVALHLGDQRFTLSRPEPNARIRSTVGHEVGGIVLKTEPVALDEWSRRLATELAELARRNDAAAAALARITSMEV